jgi:hypothetical protein
MFSKLNLAVLLGLASTITAIPRPTSVRGLLSGKEGIFSNATYPKSPSAIANAYSTVAPDPTLAPSTDGLLTIQVINSFGADVSTSHAHNADGPGAVSGNTAPGVLPAGGTASYAVPTGYAGNFAVVQNGGGRAIVGDETVVEASFVSQGSSNAIIDIDVSYV